MKRKTAYLLMLLLPIIFSAGAWGLSHFHMGHSVFNVVLPLMFQAFFGGIQYVVFAIGTALWGMKKSSEKIRQVSWWLPLVFTPICVLGSFLMMHDVSFLVTITSIKS